MLNDTQLATLKADIYADPVLAAYAPATNGLWLQIP